MGEWISKQYLTDTKSGEQYVLNGWRTASGLMDGYDVYITAQGRNYKWKYRLATYNNPAIVIPFYDRIASSTPDWSVVFTWNFMPGCYLFVRDRNSTTGNDFQVGLSNTPDVPATAQWYDSISVGSSIGGASSGTQYFALIICAGCVGVTTCDSSGVTDARYNNGVMIDVTEFANRFGYKPKFDEKEYSPEFGDPSGEGGYGGGTFDDSSDTISLPDTPTLGVSNAGFINVYNPSAGALANFGEDLFPDFTPIEGGDDTTQAIVNLGKNVTNAINMFTNSRLIDYIIDCHILPVKPEAQTAEAIKVGFRTFDQLAPKITTDYFDVDCGKLSVGEYYGNFIDYGGFTQAKLYLPFIGFIDIEPEYWQSGTLQVIYRFNVIDGSFMAFVLSTSSKSKLKDTVIGQYGGNACVHIPITGLNYSSMISGVVSGAAGVLSNVGGNVGGAASSAVQVMTSAPSMQSSNAYNATTAFLGVRTPYLLIERSVSHFSRNYANEKGIPSQISMPFKDLKGFTTATVEHLNGFEDVTEEELDEIKELLANGVIF